MTHSDYLLNMFEEPPEYREQELAKQNKSNKKGRKKSAEVEQPQPHLPIVEVMDFDFDEESGDSDVSDEL